MKNLNEFPLWTAIVTPMNEDGSIDYESFKKILLEQEAAKNALVVLGSTGEALNLNKDEAKKILEFALSLNLAVPVMTGIGGYNLDEIKIYINYLNSLKGLDAYLVVTPLYAKPGEHGQYHWFKTILDLSKRPCMLYNVPGRTAVKMNFKAINRLKDHPHFWAIKEASGSVDDFKMYKQMAPNARMYSGDDGLTNDFSKHGCVGLVSVAANAWPLETHLYTLKCVNQTLSEVDANMWAQACDTLFLAANPVPVKHLMYLNKKIKTNLLRAPLSHLDLADETPIVLAQNNIQNWFQENK